MSIRSALYTHLTTDATITALVSTRTYPVLAKESATLPYIVYALTDAFFHDGFTLQGGLTEERYDIDIVADTDPSMQSVYEVLVDSLHGKRGTLGTEALPVQSILMETASDDLFVRPDKPAEPLYIRRTEWVIKYKPTFVT